MSKYFGTDGFRGEANKELTALHAYKIGRFIGYHYGKDHKCKVVIGKDTRLSSYMYESALCAGLIASGADAYVMHVTTTPSVAYVTGTEDFDCGIMISASHNPYYDNGIKLLNGNGEKMEDDIIDLAEAYIDAEETSIPYAEKDNVGRRIDYIQGRDKYVKHLISVAKNSFKGLNIGLDCSNGASFAVAKELFSALGANVSVINDEPNGVNINTNCGSTHIEGLMSYVKENKLNAGFAFDGDADRCLCVDENGNLVDGDAIMYICGKQLFLEGELENNTVVTTVMSNMGLYKALEALGINTEKTAVGDKYVYENMKANGHCIGGEQSGHIIFSKYATTGDGMLTAIMMLEVMAKTGKSLSQLCEGFKVYPQLLKNVRVKDKALAMNDPDVLAAAKKGEEELSGEGRILVRKSGTEPIVRVMAEAKSDELCKKYVDMVCAVLEEKGHTV